ncbi:hypothetical protein [Polaribacter sp. IC073]|uniref:hypothetical protein n=1 Tax=Polaribacter sp. IC073 TaxID=2508540 RepID=UPI0011BE768C|nr:hypothetical protein [Polaribacter sp. IC073]TXD47355.1 hypothetical protein ES045_12215 [Polaribacter sp. IC073]
MIPFNEWNIKHNLRAEKDVLALLYLYDKIVNEIGLFAASIVLTKDVFKFSSFPALQKRVDSILRKHAFSVETIIDKNVANHWELSQTKNDVFEKKANKRYKQKYNPIATRNAEGLKAFRNRKNRKLSDKVWKNTMQLRTELEMAIDTAIKTGKPANQLATEIKKYLNEPDKLFRRYKDNNGLLQLSKNAKAYKPGQGVYRSSFKNAQRLARTEINMAYRLSDIDRWSKMKFVVGYEIKRSNNPFPCDICEMMKGSYPKNFVWSGNHPNCRCYLVPIMQSEDDFFNDKKAGSTDINPKFTKWIKENRTKIANAKSVPYFIKDNPIYLN